jgi:hypothetical protein
VGGGDAMTATVSAVRHFALVLPARWVKPIAKSVILPALQRQRPLEAHG